MTGLQPALIACRGNVSGLTTRILNRASSGSFVLSCDILRQTYDLMIGRSLLSILLRND